MKTKGDENLYHTEYIVSALLQKLRMGVKSYSDMNKHKKANPFRNEFISDICGYGEDI